MINSFLKLIRMRQWIKNAFILTPLMFSLNLMNYSLFAKTIFAVSAFCFVSSSVYVFNDIIDRGKDRQHPEKRNRPIASGNISVAVALVIGVLLLGLSLLISAFTNTVIVPFIIGYFILNIVYSLFLKNIVILDVMIISIGFLMRVIVGAAAISVDVSHWILLTTIFISLFLGFGKRRKEIILSNGDSTSRSVLERYSIQLLDYLVIICVTLTIITYCLYVIDIQTVQKLGTNKLIITVPLAIFGLFRYLYLIYKKQKGGDPGEVILRDVPIIIAVVLWGISVVVILYLDNYKFIK